jgi:hypothetical protein
VALTAYITAMATPKVAQVMMALPIAWAASTVKTPP